MPCVPIRWSMLAVRRLPDFCPVCWALLEPRRDNRAPGDLGFFPSHFVGLYRLWFSQWFSTGPEAHCFHRFRPNHCQSRRG